MRISYEGGLLTHFLSNRSRFLYPAGYPAGAELLSLARLDKSCPPIDLPDADDSHCHGDRDGWRYRLR